MMMSLPVSCISVKCENLSFLSGQADADTKAGPLALKCSVYLPLVVDLRTAPELSSTAEQLLFLLHILTCVSPRQVTRPLPGVPAGRHGRRSAARRAPVFKRPRERRERLLGLRLCLQGERIPHRSSRSPWSHRYEHSLYSMVCQGWCVCVHMRGWSSAVGKSDLLCQTRTFNPPKRFSWFTFQWG